MCWTLRTIDDATPSYFCHSSLSQRTVCLGTESLYFVAGRGRAMG